MYYLKALYLCVVVLLIYSGTLLAQDKCTNSTDIYLCDPGFENSARRDGTQIFPKARSGTAPVYINGVKRNYIEIKRCLGGPIINTQYWLYPKYFRS